MLKRTIPPVWNVEAGVHQPCEYSLLSKCNGTVGKVVLILVHLLMDHWKQNINLQLKTINTIFSNENVVGSISPLNPQATVQLF